MTYAKNGLQQPQPQISKPHDLSESANKALMKLVWLRLAETTALLLILGLIALSLVGCAQTSTPPSAWPLNPQPPQISLEPPNESYSQRVQSFLQRSRERLTRTPAM